MNDAEQGLSPASEVPQAAANVPAAAPPAGLSPREPAGDDPVLAMIERAARDPLVDVDKFERLMTLRERLDARRAKEAFDDAIAAAKGEIGPIIKSHLVDYEHRDQKGRTSYKHETLDDIARVIDPVLAKYGLSYRFRSAQTEAKLKVTCILTGHGHAEETTLEAGPDASGQKNAHQAIASAATYLQRYTVKLALGLAAADKDDDGRAASAEPIDEEQAAYLRRVLDETNSNFASFLKWIGAETIEAMTLPQFKKASEYLAEKKRRQKEQKP